VVDIAQGLQVLRIGNNSNTPGKAKDDKKATKGHGLVAGATKSGIPSTKMKRQLGHKETQRHVKPQTVIAIKSEPAEGKGSLESKQHQSKLGGDLQKGAGETGKVTQAVSASGMSTKLDKDLKSGIAMPNVEEEPESPTETSESFLDASTLADRTYRASCYLGLGSWDSDGTLPRAQTPSPCTENSSSSSSNPTSPTTFSQNWKAILNECPVGRSNSSGSKQPAGQSSNTGGSSHQTNQNGPGRTPKRSSGGGNGDEGGDANQPKKQKYSETPASKTTQRRFACPFHKFDPEYYRASEEVGDKYKTCGAGRGFSDIARVK